MKAEYFIGAGLVLLFLRGHKKVATSNQVIDSIPTGGSDFQGDMMARLSGADLTMPGYPNLFSGPLADPGKIGQASLSQSIAWDGSRLAA
jgi:hypothetical protein